MKVITGILLGWLLVVAAIGVVFWTGSYNVAATNSAGQFERKFAAFALNRAVQKRAPVRANPLSKPEDIREGLVHFKENCVDCHGAPGVEESEFGQGLNPPAPDLTLPSVQRMRDGELYWVVSNGIRMTGMPAFSPTHKPDEIWKMVAFVRHMPEITREEQQILKAGREEEAAHHEKTEAGGAAEAKAEHKAMGKEKSEPTPLPGTTPPKS
jgi:mono/diheme cytochrome c family protein